MTRATAAYALRCPGQCSEDKDAFGSFLAILVCNVRPPLGMEIPCSQNSAIEATHSLMASGLFFLGFVLEAIRKYPM